MSPGLGAAAVAVLLAAAYLLLDPPSADLAAQEYRTLLFERHGFLLWENGWYAGHHVPGYSVTFPPLAALLGPRLVGALAAVAAAALFERLVVPRFGAAGRVGALWFAAGAATLLVAGRLTFALGVALALGALLAAARGRPALAAALAALTALTSPVAAAFVALAAAAWLLAGAGGRTSVTLAAAAVVPVVALAPLFPEGGTFPFAPSSFWPALAATLAVLVALPREERLLRAGAALYAAALVASFALDTPVGGNAVRLGALVAGPLVACALWARDRRLVALLALPLLYWQWIAPVDDWVRAHGDPTVQARAYAGLVAFLGAQRDGPFRVEVPFTDNHWEARWLAPRVPLARGWERQLDRERNALFYDGEPLTATRYRRWLDDNAVRFVALADAPVDYSAAAEAQLVRDGLPYLRPVYRDSVWRVFEVAGARPLARGAAVATRLEADAVALRAGRAGVVDVRVRHSPYWALQGVPGCVEEGPGGWTRVRLERPGRARLIMRFRLGRGVRCG